MGEVEEHVDDVLGRSDVRQHREGHVRGEEDAAAGAMAIAKDPPKAPSGTP